MNIIEINKLTKIYKPLDFWKKERVTAVDNVSLSVKKGEVYGLLGLNGAGKTTMMKMILGLLKPTFGSILLFGRPVTDRAVRKKIGYLSELPYFPKYLKATEILDFYAELLDVPQREKKARISKVLSLVGLETRANRRIKGFSKGMQGRLGLAQAILNEPELLLLDEPMSGLDPLGYKETRDIIINLNKSGTTVFFNSHILSEVEKVCDRVSVLHGGRLVSTSAAAALKKKHGSMEGYFLHSIGVKGGIK